MAQLTTTDVGREVAKANDFYQPKDGRCVATPAQLRALLDRLEQRTSEVQEAADDEGIVSDTNVAQWASDMAAWQTRLQRYQDVLDGIPKSDWESDAGCHAAYKYVTAPLLDGIYYERLPGIVLNSEELARIASGVDHPALDVTTPGHPGGHSNPKPPDVATPFMLGNQVVTYGQWQDEMWRLFWEDVVANAKKLASGNLPFDVPPWIKWTAIGAAVLVVSAVGYGIYGRARGPRRNTKGSGNTKVAPKKPHMKTYPARRA
jgi:hypothetical protein